MIGSGGTSSADHPRQRRIEYVFTSDERTVMRGIVDGEPMKAIAQTLGVHVPRAYDCRRQLLARLGFRSDADLIKFVLMERVL